MNKQEIESEKRTYHLIDVAGTILLLILVTIVLGGCGNRGDVTQEYKLPEGLKDCKVYSLTSDLTVVRCPSSSTAVSYRVQRGKSSTTYMSSVIS